MHIPVFGEWNQLQCEELPMTQYFESAMQAGLVARAGHCFHDGAAEVVLFRTLSGSPPPHKPAKKVEAPRRRRHLLAAHSRDLAISLLLL